MMQDCVQNQLMGQLLGEPGRSANMSCDAS